MSDQYIYRQVCSRWAGLAVTLDLHKLVPALAPAESRHGYREQHTSTRLRAFVTFNDFMSQFKTDLHYIW